MLIVSLNFFINTIWQTTKKWNTSLCLKV